MVKYLKKNYLFSVLILLSAIISIILSSCGGGEGNLAVNSLTPTPRDPMDPFYDENVEKVTIQFGKWKKDLGGILAVQKTVDWVNGKVPEVPRPEYIKKAEIDQDDKESFYVYFIDGWSANIYTKSSASSQPIYTSYVKEEINGNLVDRSNLLPITNSIATAPQSNQILILAPHIWEFQLEGTVERPADPDLPCKFDYTVYGELADYLMSLRMDPNDPNSFPVYDVKRIMTQWSDIDHTYNDKNKDGFPDPVWNWSEWGYIETWKLKEPEKNSVAPQDFEDIGKYGIIFIYTHGNETKLSLGPVYETDPKKQVWITNHNSEQGERWEFRYQARTRFDEQNKERTVMIKCLVLFSNFFEGLDCKDAIVYIQACDSASITSENNSIRGAFSKNNNILIGNTGYTDNTWADMCSYFFFRYMIYGYDEYPFGNYLDNPQQNINPQGRFYKPYFYGVKRAEKPEPPMSVRGAYNKLNELNMTDDENTYIVIEDGIEKIEDGSSLVTATENTSDVYFPVPVNIIVHKNK